MAANESTQHNTDEQQKKGATEDPPVDATKQNKPGTEGSSTVDVPKEAVENYKEAGREGEE